MLVFIKKTIEGIMKKLHQAALMLALAASAMPAFAFYQVVEETVRLEIAPGNIKSDHVDYTPSPGSFDEYHYHSFDQDLATGTATQYLLASLERSVPSRRGDSHHLSLSVFASASGAGLSNITQTAEYEVVFDLFSTSLLQVLNPAALKFESIASDNTRQVIAFPKPYLEDSYLYSQQIPAVAPGRYAITLNLAFSPLDSSLAGGQMVYDNARFMVFQSAVPEPASWALVGFGVFGLVATRRRRHGQS